MGVPTYLANIIVRINRVVEIVESLKMEDQIVIMSLKMAAVKKMKALRPRWRVGLLMSFSAGDLDALDVDFLAVNAAFVNPRFVRSTHRSGKQVHVWTVNDAPTMSMLIGRGVDNLITAANCSAVAGSVDFSQLASSADMFVVTLTGQAGDRVRIHSVFLWIAYKF